MVPKILLILPIFLAKKDSVPLHNVKKLPDWYGRAPIRWVLGGIWVWYTHTKADKLTSTSVLGRTGSFHSRTSRSPIMAQIGYSWYRHRGIETSISPQPESEFTLMGFM